MRYIIFLIFLKNNTYILVYYFQDLSMAQQQCFLDSISRDSEKLMVLTKCYSVDQELQSKAKRMREQRMYCNVDAEEKERREQQEFQEELEREAEEKNMLLQCVINEAASAGYPLPAS